MVANKIVTSFAHTLGNKNNMAMMLHNTNGTKPGFPKLVPSACQPLMVKCTEGIYIQG